MVVGQFDVPGADDGLAVDDFSLTPYTAPLPSPSPAPVCPRTPGQLPHRHLSGTDRPRASATLTFSLPAGQADNVCSSLPAPRYQARYSFDYEVRSSYTVVVRVTDIVGLHLDKSFNIEIIDVYDPPSGIVSLNVPGGAYFEDFDTLVSSGSSGTVPEGWYFLETGTSTYKNTAYRANDGSSNIGDTYSYGGAGSAERAFGSLRSNALIPRFGAQFTNNTGHPIHALQISYVGEQWRLGATGRGADRLDFQLSTNATDLSSGSWTDYDLLDFSSPVTSGTVGALNGNAAANRATLGYTITGLDIPNGSAFWVRWVDADVLDAHDGLAVDDFSLTPYTAPTTISLSGTSLPENAGVNFPIGTLSGTDPDPGQSATLTFSLPAGQADNDLFVLAGTTLQARYSFDYEVRSSYTVVVRATDITDLNRDETFLISVTDVNEAPVITSHGGAATAAVSVPENTTAVTTLTASDPDGDTLTYSILGGVDQAHFVLDAASGLLSFVSAPDFEQPADADADNVYEVTVQVSDGLLTATQSLLVTVTDVAEPPAAHTLVYTAGRGGSVVGEAKQVVKRGGEGTAVSAVPQSGYHFVRWSDGLRTATRVDSDVTSDIWVKALFEHDATVVTHALSYSAGVGGSIRGEASQIVEDGGTGAEVEAVPDSGYRFLVWSDGVQSARRVDAGVSADLSVVAEFAPVGVGADRWTDIGGQEWVDVYGVTACQVDMVADGLNDGRFGPGLAVNRSQFAKMVVDGFGLPKHAPLTPSFNDVGAAHFFFEWIEGAAALNVVLGYEDRGFRPEWSITRQQACSILGRHLAQQEMGQSGSIRGELGSYTSVEQWYETEGVSLLAPFADAGRVFTVHAPYTAYLLYHEVIWGSLSEGQCLLDPLSDLTRAQAAVLVVRMGLSVDGYHLIGTQSE